MTMQNLNTQDEAKYEQQLQITNYMPQTQQPIACSSNNTAELGNLLVKMDDELNIM